ncbi:ClbS/DfsB family four-helix bundle protein [Cognatishimia sp. MH4019]|uniref:ClbS/DfsB family four-helix bundle protein n=1 Tax=Cognatishimia sp. MH4019 TaxID=2854030 RepID=UPI001CD79966|nr:ClbS/DfsB family four-helix bundle protein [Cognatishimia sp. MH4019]
MPAATTKTDLLSVLESEWGKLSNCLAQVSEDVALAPDDAGATIKDVLGHRAAWIELYLGWVAQSASGGPIFMPAEGYKWNMLPELNAKIRQDQSNLGWSDVVALLEARKAALVATLETSDDAMLYGGPMPGGNGKWTMGRYAEAAGPSHFRSAAKFIRARLRASRM